MNRRLFLRLLSALGIAWPTALLADANADSRDELVIVDGWILKVSDLEGVDYDR